MSMKPGDFERLMGNMERYVQRRGVVTERKAAVLGTGEDGYGILFQEFATPLEARFFGGLLASDRSQLAKALKRFPNQLPFFERRLGRR